MISAKPEPPFDGLVARLTAKAQALAEAHAEAHAARGRSRWRDARRLWPLFTGR